MGLMLLCLSYFAHTSDILNGHVVLSIYIVIATWPELGRSAAQNIVPINDSSGVNSLGYTVSYAHVYATA